MAFNYNLAARSMGVNAPMYADNLSEAQKLFDEDLRARIAADPNQVRKDMMKQRALEARGQIGNAVPDDPPAEQPQAAQQAAPQQPQQPQAPQVQRGMVGNAMGDAPIRWPGMHPASHFGAQNSMIAATNAAIGREMDSRRSQAEAARERQHEQQLAANKQQQQQQQQQQAAQPLEEVERIRKARNRSLLGAAGLGGYSIKSGKGGTIRKPHQFGNSPFASALLGD